MKQAVRDCQGRVSPKAVPLDHYVVAEMTGGNKVRGIVAADVRMSDLIGTLQVCRQAGCDVRSHKPFTTQRMRKIFRLLRRTVEGYKTVRFAISGNAV